MSRLERGIKNISELLRVIDPYSIVYTLRWFTTESAGFLRELASYIHVILGFTICTRALYYCDQLCRKGLPKYT